MILISSLKPNVRPKLLEYGAAVRCMNVVEQAFVRENFKF